MDILCGSDDGECPQRLQQGLLTLSHVLAYPDFISASKAASAIRYFACI